MLGLRAFMMQCGRSSLTKHSLLETRGVESGVNRVRVDDGDGPSLVARRGNDAEGLARGLDLSSSVSLIF